MSRVNKPRNKYVNSPHCDEDKEEYEDAMDLLASIGVPFGPDGTPLGIGWDD